MLPAGDWQSLQQAVSRSSPTLSLQQVVAVGRVYLKPIPTPATFNKFAQAVAAQVQPAAVHPVIQKSSSRKPTEQQQKFFATLASSTSQEAVDHIRSRIVGKKTAEQYRSSIPLYVASCETSGIPPWPATFQSVEVFGGYLALSQAYKQPAGHLHAVMHESKIRTGKKADFDIDDVVKGVERDLEDAEQAEPISIAMLRNMAKAAETPIDYNCWLMTAGAFFSLARADSFIHVRAADITIKNAKANITLRNLKGYSPNKSVVLEFEQTTTRGMAPFKVGDRVIPCCPVAVLSVLRAELEKAGQGLFKQTQSMRRALDVLVEKTGIDNHPKDKDRALYSCHSTRVGGTCVLLKSGLSEKVISTVALWKSNMIAKYSERVIREPSLVESFRFYNPQTLNGAYVGLGACGDEPSAKVRKTSSKACA